MFYDFFLNDMSYTEQLLLFKNQMLIKLQNIC